MTTTDTNNNASRPPLQLLLTAEEVQHALGIGATTYLGLVRSGRLQTVTIGRARRVLLTSLEAFVSELKAKAEGATADVAS